MDPSFVFVDKRLSGESLCHLIVSFHVKISIIVDFLHDATVTLIVGERIGEHQSDIRIEFLVFFVEI